MVLYPLLFIINYPILSLDKDFVNHYINNMNTDIKKCEDCGCIPKNDEWYTPRSDIFKGERFCFDCGGEAEHEFWVDYAQRKMEL
jgi:hypothetical protein